RRSGHGRGGHGRGRQGWGGGGEGRYGGRARRDHRGSAEVGQEDVALCGDHLAAGTEELGEQRVGVRGGRRGHRLLLYASGGGEHAGQAGSDAGALAVHVEGSAGGRRSGGTV